MAMRKSKVTESAPPMSLIKPAGSDTASKRSPLLLKSRTGSGPQNLRDRIPFDCVALLLQGGGALGAYQAGVYEALAESGLHPDWVVGISIGAINSAIIAGNAPERRID